VAAPPAKDPRREDHDEQQNDEAHHKVDWVEIKFPSRPAASRLMGRRAGVRGQGSAPRGVRPALARGPVDPVEFQERLDVCRYPVDGFLRRSLVCLLDACSPELLHHPREKKNSVSTGTAV
jgi:hypothetical protein